MCRVGGLLLLTLAACYPAPGQELTFGSAIQERVFRIRDGAFTTVNLRVIANPARNFAVSSSEFAICPETGPALTAYDFIYQRSNVEESAGGRRLVVSLHGRRAPLDVTLIYEVEPGKPWMRKRLRIAPRQGSGAFVVSRIDVERLGVQGGPVSGGGAGKPLLY